MRLPSGLRYGTEPCAFFPVAPACMAHLSVAAPPASVEVSLMIARECSISDALRCQGIPRRKFLKFCGSMATVLGLPLSAAPQVAATLEKKRRPVLVWLELQDCAGNSESMLRSSHPPIADLVLSFFSWEYHETIMAAAGKQADSA